MWTPRVVWMSRAGDIRATAGRGRANSAAVAVTGATGVGLGLGTSMARLASPWTQAVVAGVRSWRRGGLGGGAVQLVVPRALQLDGSILANGRPGGSNFLSGTSYFGGGGAGGSIDLRVGTLAGGGLIQAAGGSAMGTGAGGGGGRIAIYHLGMNVSTVSNLVVNGGAGGGGANGSAGTIFLEPPLFRPDVSAWSPNRIVNHPVGWVDLEFPTLVRPESFPAADILFTTPTGRLAAAELSLTPSRFYSWRVSFPLQSTEGIYTVQFGPHLLNYYDQEMSAPFVGYFGVDTTPPQIECPASVTLDTNPGECVGTAAWTVTATDNFTNVVIACIPPEGAALSIGTREVTCTATDLAGNTDTCAFAVTVRDPESPVIHCAGPVTVMAESNQCFQVVTWPAVTAADRCSEAAVSCTPPSGASFPVGRTDVVCRAVDAGLNAVTCSFSVTVYPYLPPPAVQWLHAYGGSSKDYLIGANDTRDGGFILAGMSTSPAGGNKTSPQYGLNDYLVVRTDAAGNKLWDQSLGGTAEDYAYAVAELADGSVVVGGSSFSLVDGNKSDPNLWPAGGSPDGWIVRLNGDGTKAWDKSFGGTSWDYFFDLQLAADGGILAVGCSASQPGTGNKTSPNYGSYDAWVVMLDANGQITWDESYGGSSADELYKVRQTRDGGYVLAGFSMSPGHPSVGTKRSANYGGWDYWVVRLSTNRTVLWENSYGGSGDDYLQDITETADGGFLLGGYSASPISGNKTDPAYGGNDGWIVRVDANGNKLWDRSLGGSAADDVVSVSETIDGLILVGGHSASPVSGNQTCPGHGGSDVWMVLLDSQGRKIWDQTYGGTGDDGCWKAGIRPLPGGGFIVAGATASPGISAYGDADGWLMRLEPLSVPAPTMVCSTNMVVDAPTHAGATVDFSVTASNRCSPSVVCVPPSGSLFPVGTNLVSCAAHTPWGSSECAFSVVVSDAEVAFTVMTTADSGPGSLRAVIDRANRDPDTNCIDFVIPGSGVRTIAPLTPLPPVLYPVILDGATQRGYTGTPVIELTGELMQEYVAGLEIRGGHSTVRGLVINRFAGPGLLLATNGTNLVEGNYIGLDAAGALPAGNGRTNYGPGLAIQSSAANRIGGTNAFQRNVVSGNIGYGIEILIEDATNNLVVGNYIGTAPNGMSALANGGGMWIASPRNCIGGTEPGMGNLISGNTFTGIWIAPSSGKAEQNRIQGNWIGLDATGTASLANGRVAVYATGTWGTVIGGAEPGARNVIAGFGFDIQSHDVYEDSGIYLRLSWSNVVCGNFLGTDITGTRAVDSRGPGVCLRDAWDNWIGGDNPGQGNVIAGTWEGISIYSGASNVISGNWIGTDPTESPPMPNAIGIDVERGTGNRIGGTTPGTANHIAFNWTGIRIVWATNTAILGNAIYENEWSGIDLTGDGFTPNDPGDTDTGPNDLQNYPVLTSVRCDGDEFVLEGYLDSEAARDYRVEIFANPTASTNGYGQGRYFLGYVNVRTDAQGRASFEFQAPRNPARGQYLAATASSLGPSYTNTSEFSAWIRMDADPPVIRCTNLVSLTHPGQSARTNVTYAPAAYDPCSDVSVVCDPPSGSTFPVGTSTVNCTATDWAGNHSACSFTVTITQGVAPVVVVPLTNQSHYLETDVTFAVVATGTEPLQYEWSKDGLLLANGPTISGADGPVLTVRNIQVNDCGFYRVVVSNPSGSASSEASLGTRGERPLMAVFVSLSQPFFVGTCFDALYSSPGPSPRRIVNYEWDFGDGSGRTNTTCSQICHAYAACGDYAVTLVITDDSVPAKTNRVTRTVTVVDMVAPTITCATNCILIEGSRQTGCHPAVTWPGPECSSCYPVVCTPPSGSSFPVGTNVVTCAPAVPGGSSASCAFTVVVLTPFEERSITYYTNKHIRAISPLEDGGFVVCFEYNDFTDYSVARLDSKLKVVWERPYAPPNMLLDCEPTRDGGFIACGSSTNQLGHLFYRLVRLDRFGNELWERSYGGPGVNRLEKVCQLPDGGYLLGGCSHAPRGGSKTSLQYGQGDIWMVCVEANGDWRWDQSFGGTEFDYLTDFEVTADDCVIVCGATSSSASGNKQSPNYGGADLWVLCLDRLGNLRWERSLGGADHDIGRAVRATADGHYYIAGTSRSGPGDTKSSPNYGDHDAWLLYLDADGNKLWDKSYGGASNDSLFDIALAPDGSVVLPINDVFPILHVDSSGRTLRQRVFVSCSGWESHILCDRNGDFILAADEDCGPHATAGYLRRFGYGPVVQASYPSFVQASSVAGANVHYTVTATNACATDIPVNCSPAPGSLFPIGVRTVTCVARDNAGGVTTERFQFTVGERSDIHLENGTPVMTWDAIGNDYRLEETIDLTPGNPWQPSSVPVIKEGEKCKAILPKERAQYYYRFTR